MLVTSYDARIRSRSQTASISDPPFPVPMAAHCPSGVFSIAFTGPWDHRHMRELLF